MNICACRRHRRHPDSIPSLGETRNIWNMPISDPFCSRIRLRRTTRCLHACYLPHGLIETYRICVIGPDIEVDEPGAFNVALTLECFGELSRVTLPTRLRGDSQGSDMNVPREVMHVAVAVRVIVPVTGVVVLPWRAFDFAQHCNGD